MFEVREMPEPIAADKIAKLRQVEAATVGHFLHGQFASNDIQGILDDVRISGTAVTLRIPGPDSTLLHYATDLLRQGDVLVIDRCGDQKHACFGGVLAFVAAKIGLAGVIIDGPVADIGEIRRNGVPVWCTGRSPITTKILGLEGVLNGPVSVGGCAVEPGDAVLADEGGVLFLKPNQIDPVADRALEMQANEITLIERLKTGESLPGISGARDHVQANLVK